MRSSLVNKQESEENSRIARAEFFDKLADRWDSMIDMDRVRRRLQQGLESLRISPAERVLDLGCGTGNLLASLDSYVNPEAVVMGIDFSMGMLTRARDKICDSRTILVRAAAESMPLQDMFFNRIFCFSTWPHFPHPVRVAKELHRTLSPGGLLHIWHVDSRETINRIHQNSDDSIRRDLLPAAAVLADTLSALGYEIVSARDTSEEFMVTARRPRVASSGE